MARLERARWWSVRTAQNRKPATYRCPLCGNYLPSLSDHMLIAPEGDASRRRHAHTECVLLARRQGRLPTKAEWQRGEPRPARAWRRVEPGKWTFWRRGGAGSRRWWRRVIGRFRGAGR